MGCQDGGGASGYPAPGCPRCVRPHRCTHHHVQALPALLLLSPGGERVIERWEAGAGAPAPPADLLLRRFLSDATSQRISTLRQAPTPTLTLTLTVTLTLALTLTLTLTLALTLTDPNPNPSPDPDPNPCRRSSKRSR